MTGSTQPPNLAPITVTLSVASQITGLSRSTLLRRANEGTLDTVRVGGRRLVKMHSLQKLVSGKADARSA